MSAVKKARWPEGLILSSKSGNGKSVFENGSMHFWQVWDNNNYRLMKTYYEYYTPCSTPRQCDINKTLFGEFAHCQPDFVPWLPACWCCYLPAGGVCLLPTLISLLQSLWPSTVQWVKLSKQRLSTEQQTDKSSHELVNIVDHLAAEEPSISPQ